MKWLIDFLNAVPIVLFAASMLILTKEYFFVACLGLTALVGIVQVWLYPLICAPCLEKSVVFPEEFADLKGQIEKLCDEMGFNSHNIGVFESQGGDLHSNAYTTTRVIRISHTILEHHKGQNDEILAIIMHELGHRKRRHVLKMLVINTVYMTIFGALLIPMIDRVEFLASFGMYMDSYVMTLAFFTLLYQRTVDIPLRLLIRLFQRKFEKEADQVCIDRG